MTSNPRDTTTETPAEYGPEPAADSGSDDGFGDDLEFDLDADQHGPVQHSPERVRIGGGDGLSMTEVNDLVGSVPSVVVLVAGEANAGKTTLLVELFAQFLAGPVAGWRYAGSNTLQGFDRRHRPARASSGSSTATTARTQDDDLRHLHLALATEDRRIEFVFSDIRGEIFEGIIDGQPAREDLPFLPRVDFCLVLLDGEQMGRRSFRDLQVLRGRQLVSGLLEADAMRDGSEIMVIATKADTLDKDVRSEVEQELHQFETLLGTRSVSLKVHTLSARPADGSPSFGLPHLLNYLTKKEDGIGFTGHRAEVQGRYYWRGSL
ncbi:hypothetical protein [Frigoribacterium sp. PhB116]|uniref:TRAFAC clade GTPase domain-containing protein n=1 Tax=Frigoribacterium sp. PhB116 TaxID=2485174 RepID=UPI00106190A3|nr:hypothetical protein [Frigoribacterium sp. PhB116]TDT61720.1 hypothetical protein EDF20_3015 [Frigoribacterium sp. PhB116]